MVARLESTKLKPVLETRNARTAERDAGTLTELQHSAERSSQRRTPLFLRRLLALIRRDEGAVLWIYDSTLLKFEGFGGVRVLLLGSVAFHRISSSFISIR